MELVFGWDEQAPGSKERYEGNLNIDDLRLDNLLAQAHQNDLEAVARDEQTTIAPATKPFTSHNVATAIYQDIGD